MRKIRIIEHISLGGVIQAPGGPDEDRDSDYKLGGWSVPFADPAVGVAILAAYSQSFDLLLGRAALALRVQHEHWQAKKFTTKTGIWSIWVRPTAIIMRHLVGKTGTGSYKADDWWL